MRKYLSLILFVTALFFVPTRAFAFSDVNTHPDITKAAIVQSILKTYLQDNLGFKNGLGEIIQPKKTIQILITNGAKTEDSGTLPSSGICFRGLNHFYDPLTQQGLDERTNFAALLPGIGYLTPILWQGYANYYWAEGDYDATTVITQEPQPSAQKSREKNEYSWKRARKAFATALTSITEDERNRLFARTFRSVGQVVHLLQDMAVPAHVRNDMRGHLDYQKYLHYKFKDDGYFAWKGNNFEAYVETQVFGDIESGAVPSFRYLRDYWDEGVYEKSRNIDDIGLGLAEYTSANFLSSNKMLDSRSYPHPSENDGTVDLCDVKSNDGKIDKAYYFKMEKGEAKVNHLSHSKKSKGVTSSYVIFN